MIRESPATRRIPGSLGRRAAAWLLLVASAGGAPALAQSDASDEDALPWGWRWEGRRTLAPTAAPHPSVLPMPFPAPFGSASSLPRAAADGVPPIDYRLWFGDRRTEVGLGLANAPGTVLAFRHQLSPNARLIVDTRLGSDSLAPGSRARDLPLGVELESTRWYDGLAKGQLLRAQLDLRTSLALRVRGGRLGVYLQMRTADD